MVGDVAGGFGIDPTEEAFIDHQFGRFVNNNLAPYYVVMPANVSFIKTLMINKRDPLSIRLGAGGIGDFVLIGFTGAVANAIFNATGQRVRDLPITPDT